MNISMRVLVLKFARVDYRQNYQIIKVFTLQDYDDDFEDDDGDDDDGDDDRDRKPAPVSQSSF